MIEIGLTVVDLSARERIAKHRILVRPERSSVSPFCAELTGLTQAEVDSGSPTPKPAAYSPPNMKRAFAPGRAGATTTANSSSANAGRPASNTRSARCTPTPNWSSRRRMACAGAKAWRARCASQDSHWRDGTIAARTTPGISPPWSSTWSGALPGIQQAVSRPTRR
ncbi:hypothetical protein [Nocardia sp. CA-119907]|uniref:hypothetical protein n=1 Tax=Nocardia sp. CA-119907 TaxID=3239973 RepID=UPI003D952FFD